VTQPTVRDRAAAQIGKPYFSATATDSLLGELVDRIDVLTGALREARDELASLATGNYPAGPWKHAMNTIDHVLGAP
jgi:hypothetical protein